MANNIITPSMVTRYGIKMFTNTYYFIQNIPRQFQDQFGIEGARIGADCNICDYTFIEGGVVLGDRVTVKCGVQLCEGVTLEDDVFVGPNATFTNDPFPRSGRRIQQFARTLVRRGASVGAQATILPGVTIGSGAMVSGSTSTATSRSSRGTTLR